jgi:serine/threonine protein kinase
MAYVKHENVVSLRDFYVDEENYYVIMDLCGGGDLASYLGRNGALTEIMAARIFWQIVAGLKHLHSCGVAHRDLKPENVLFNPFPRVRIADFGLCGLMTDDFRRQTFCGSPCYCSPECLCKVAYDPRISDVWSLGVILYALLTGCIPWQIENASRMLRQILTGFYDIPEEVSPEAADLISCLLKVNPRERISLDDVGRHPWFKILSAQEKACRCYIKVDIPELEKGRRGANEIVSPLKNRGLGCGLPVAAGRRSSAVTFNRLSLSRNQEGEDGRRRSAARLLLAMVRLPSHRRD